MWSKTRGALLRYDRNLRRQGDGLPRISKSLKTTDLGAAVQLATERTLEAMAKERTVVKVVGGTIGDAIDAYEAKQRQNVADLRNNCDAVWGLDTALADMKQERWDQYISSQDGIKLHRSRLISDSARR